MWQRLIVIALVFSAINASPVEKQTLCSNGNDDSIYCSALSFLEKTFDYESKTIEQDFEARSNGYYGGESSNVFKKIQNFIKGHDFTIDFPSQTAKMEVSARKLDNDEIDFKLKLSDKSNGVESRKSKLKKVFIPIMIFVLLKAITLIPMALGVLGLKAWNSLQLSFFSFMVSVGLAIFQLCKKLANDNHHAHIAAHGPWDAGRNFLDVPEVDTSNHEIVYNGQH